MTSLNIQPQTEKENNKRTKSRAGSVPPRTITPPNPIHHYVPPKSHHGGSSRDKAERAMSGGITPAVRPGSSMSRSAPSSKRQKLGESTSSHNNSVPAVPSTRSTSRGPSGRPTSPSKIPSRNLSTSALPRPVPVQTHSQLAMPVPKHPSVVLGHGRAPSSIQRAAPGYHPYPQTQRSTSTSSQQPRAYGSVALNSSMSAGAARKASRVRRESFKPRPSVDEAWTSTTATGRYPGFSGGVVTEESEDYY